ncbi:hypothetical protein KCP73_00985 [Salmonella enterica subsp. enterica]|nr:hypothetical protein KCP73_00985 [Salmonella enterica subsp. enterica]
MSAYVDGLDWRACGLMPVMVSSLTGKGSEVTLRRGRAIAITQNRSLPVKVYAGVLKRDEIAFKSACTLRARIAAHKPMAPGRNPCFVRCSCSEN